MQSDWSKTFLITTEEIDFSQPCGFYRFSKVVYYLKLKNHIGGPILPSKSVFLAIVFSEHLGYFLTKPKENYNIKL